MCDCQSKIREEIKDDEAAATRGMIIKYVLFDMSNIKDMSGEVKQKKTGQRLTIVYSFLNKKGETKEKNEKTFISHDFCPWCGVKYK